MLMGAFGPTISKELAEKIQKDCKVKIDLHGMVGDSVNPVIITAQGCIEPNVNGITLAIALIEEANPDWEHGVILSDGMDISDEKVSAIFLPKNGW